MEDLTPVLPVLQALAKQAHTACGVTHVRVRALEEKPSKLATIGCLTLVGGAIVGAIVGGIIGHAVQGPCGYCFGTVVYAFFGLLIGFGATLLAWVVWLLVRFVKRSANPS